MLSWVEVHLGAIKENIRRLKKLIGPKVGLIAVVKSNAYGHGLLESARAMVEAKVDFLAVFDLEEALLLKKAGFSVPILIMGGLKEEEAEDVSRFGFHCFAWDWVFLKRLSAAGGGTIHLKVDTGMHRLGLFPEKLADFLPKLKKLKKIRLGGLASHFASADERDYSLFQLERFQKAIRLVEQAGFRPKVHMANSIATLFLPEARFDFVRPGALLYGFSPNPSLRLPLKLEPALTLKTTILEVKDVPAAVSVGYGRTYQTEKPSRLAVLGIGYAHGYDRRFSNKGEVLIKGVRCPVIGRVCMNQTIVNLNPLGKLRVKPGDCVTLIGQDGDDRITVEEIAQKAKMVPHEVTSRIPKEIKRIYVD